MKETVKWVVPRVCLIALITALFLYLDYGPGVAPWGYQQVWYSGAYTLVVLVMGIYVMRKYDNAHVRKRTLTLMIVQLLPNFLLANFILQDWRAHVLIRPWPLSGPGRIFGKGILAIGALNINLLWYGIGFLAILSIAVFIYGRRVQCSWICTYGALAETLGEPWRNRAPEGKVYGRWEWISIVVLAVVLLLTIWLFIALMQTGGLKAVQSIECMRALSHSLPMRLYKALVCVGLMSIVAISMYPIFGGRIWCRFFCPAGRLFRWIGGAGRTVITGSKENCIKCGKCTRVCEMGIDVCEYVQSGLPIRQGCCVGCAICIAVCPKNNLHFATR